VKKLLIVLPLAMILFFMVGCQEREAAEELEGMKSMV
jgi:outer membrane lipoprotein-sorting protein